MALTFSDVKPIFPLNFKLILNQGAYTAIVSAQLDKRCDVHVQLCLSGESALIVDDIVVRSKTCEVQKIDILRTHLIDFAASIDRFALDAQGLVIAIWREAQGWMYENNLVPDEESSEKSNVSTATNLTPQPPTNRQKSKQSATSDENLESASKSSLTDSSAKKGPMKTAEDVIHRIQWDESLPSENVVVGYTDRMLGIVERPFNDFSWEDYATVDDPNTLAVPRHRIQYFKYRAIKVWDRTARLDLIFGSTGNLSSSISIADIVAMGQREEAQFCQDENVDLESDTDYSPFTSPDHESDDTPFINSTPSESEAQVKYTHFIAVPIHSEDIQRKVVGFQQAFQATFPNGCRRLEPIERLHVTLALISLKEPIASNEARLIEIFNRQSDTIFQEINAMANKGIAIDGLTLLKERVIAANVDVMPLQAILTRHLTPAFVAEGFTVELPYVYHLTLARTRKPAHRNALDCLKDFLNVSPLSGVECIESVQLRKLGSGKLLAFT